MQAVFVILSVTCCVILDESLSHFTMFSPSVQWEENSHSLSTSDLSIKKFSFSSVNPCLAEVLCNNFLCDNTLDFILVRILLTHVSRVAVRLYFETIFFFGWFFFFPSQCL